LIANKIVKELFDGAELADVVDRLSGQEDMRSSLGMMGVITNGTLPRDECYAHGVTFAFAPFVSGKQYWDDDEAGNTTSTSQSAAAASTS
jgi:inosine/xanthosine triphosphatase